jgi:hypothetical protein
MKTFGISPFFIKYIVLWTSFRVVAVFILVWDRKRLLHEWREYFRFLSVPWKLWLFVPALLFVTFAGRYTNDETWDVATGSGMAILTFLHGNRGGTPRRLGAVAPRGPVCDRPGLQGVMLSAERNLRANCHRMWQRTECVRRIKVTVISMGQRNTSIVN